MEYNLNPIIEIPDTIGELGGIDISPLKKAKAGESWVMVYMPEKKRFGFIKLAGKRNIKK